MLKPVLEPVLAPLQGAQGTARLSVGWALGKANVHLWWETSSCSSLPSLPTTNWNIHVVKLCKMVDMKAALPFLEPSGSTKRIRLINCSNRERFLQDKKYQVDALQSQWSHNWWNTLYIIQAGWKLQLSSVCIHMYKTQNTNFLR